MRQTREKLNARSGARPEFHYELLTIFVKSELTASLAIPVLAVVVAVGLLPWAPLESILRWLATLFISKGVLIFLCRRLQMTPRKQANSLRWRRTLALGEFFYGVTWASVAFVDVSGGDQKTAFFFIFAAIMVVVAMRTMFASTVLPILYAGTIPMTFALALRFALTGDPFYWAMAGVAVGIHVYLIFLASGLQSTVVAMLEYRAEKDALVAELEQAARTARAAATARAAEVPQAQAQVTEARKAAEVASAAADAKERSDRDPEPLRMATGKLQAIMHKFAELMYSAPDSGDIIS